MLSRIRLHYLFHRDTQTAALSAAARRRCVYAHHSRIAQSEPRGQELNAIKISPLVESWNMMSENEKCTSYCYKISTWARPRGRGTPATKITTMTSSGHVTSPIDSARPPSCRLPTVNSPLSPVVFPGYSARTTYRM